LKDTFFSQPAWRRIYLEDYTFWAVKRRGHDFNLLTPSFMLAVSVWVQASTWGFINSSNRVSLSLISSCVDIQCRYFSLRKLSAAIYSSLAAVIHNTDDLNKRFNHE
jgi:hypothetical protein